MPSQPTHLTLGELGETFVAHWLATHHHQILYRRWSCRMGELDLIAVTPDRTIALIEVKTRSAGNWDLDGLLAVSASKREKLWKTAELFLAAHPDRAHQNCRFDVALVRAHKRQPTGDKPWQLIAGRYLSLQDYLEDAFSG
jgi:putative endonuclease